MKSHYVYAVIGSGKQGTAEGYDLAKFGYASKVIMIDRDPQLAEQAAQRINSLIGKKTAEFNSLDANDEKALTEFLKNHKVNVCCGAAHYGLNLSLTRASISAGDSPDEEVISIDCSFPVALSLADTLTMPLASMSNETSIWGRPLGAGAMPVRSNRPSNLLSDAISRSPGAHGWSPPTGCPQPLKRLHFSGQGWWYFFQSAGS